MDALMGEVAEQGALLKKLKRLFVNPRPAWIVWLAD